MKNILPILALALLLPGTAFADDPGSLTSDMVFCMEGFGDSGFDGTYSYSGLDLTGFDSTHPAFYKDGTDVTHSFGEIADPSFSLSTHGAAIVFYAESYFRNTSGGVEGAYTENLGDPPGGTVTLGACEGGEEDPPGGTGTSTPVLNRDEQLFIYGIVIFALFFPVWDVMFRPVRRMYDNNQGV